MMQWLEHPMEIGYAPEELVLLTTEDYPSETGEKLTLPLRAFARNREAPRNLTKIAVITTDGA